MEVENQERTLATSTAGNKNPIDDKLKMEKKRKTTKKGRKTRKFVTIRSRGALTSSEPSGTRAGEGLS